jgi:TolA-binding protein
MKQIVFVLTLSILSICSGCVSYYRAQEIETHLLTLQNKVEQLRIREKKAKEENEATIAYLKKEFERMNAQFKDALGKLQKTTAADGGVLNDLDDQTRDLKGEIRILRREIEELKNLQTSNKTVQTELPQEKNALFVFAEEHMLKKKYKEAIKAYTTFYDSYPDEIRADDALYRIAEAYYEQMRYQESIDTIQTIIKEYADQGQADKALILLHQAYLALDDCKRAKSALTYLKQTYPSSNQIRVAKRQLKILKKCKK